MLIVFLIVLGASPAWLSMYWLAGVNFQRLCVCAYELHADQFCSCPLFILNQASAGFHLSNKLYLCIPLILADWLCRRQNRNWNLSS